MLDNAYGNWAVVIGVTVLAIFLITRYLPMRTRFEKRSGGVLIAFVIALFTEMYGFPLTIYLLSAFFGIDIPLTHVESHLLGTFLTSIGFGNGWMIVMVISALLLILGAHYIAEGWKQVYRAKGELVATGVYNQMRHPQYTGIYLVIIGFLIQWPTLLTLIMFPFLAITYYNLAKREERDIRKKFPEEYRQYAEKTPMFIPKRLQALINPKYK